MRARKLTHDRSSRHITTTDKNRFGQFGHCDPINSFEDKDSGSLLVSYLNLQRVEIQNFTIVTYLVVEHNFLPSRILWSHLNSPFITGDLITGHGELVFLKSAKGWFAVYFSRIDI